MSQFTHCWSMYTCIADLEPVVEVVVTGNTTEQSKHSIVL